MKISNVVCDKTVEFRTIQNSEVFKAKPQYDQGADYRYYMRMGTTDNGKSVNIESGRTRSFGRTAKVIPVTATVTIEE